MSNACLGFSYDTYSLPKDAYDLSQHLSRPNKLTIHERYLFGFH